MKVEYGLVICLALASCSKNDKAPIGAGGISPSAHNDRSLLDKKLAELSDVAKRRATPDQAIESFIAVRNRQAELACYINDQSQQEGETASESAATRSSVTYLTFFTGKAEASKKPDPDKALSDCLKGVSKLSLDIKDVKEETPTRAIVVANLSNITAVPDGAVPDDWDKKHRSEGENFKYQLTKLSDGWKIAQVYTFDEYIKHDWEAKYKDTPQVYYPALVWPD